MAGLFPNVIICNPPNMSIRYVVLFSFYRSGNGFREGKSPDPGRTHCELVLETDFNPVSPGF